MEIWFLGCILILGGSSKGLKEEITKYADSDAEYVGYKEKSEYSVIIPFLTLKEMQNGATPWLYGDKEVFTTTYHQRWQTGCI